MPEKLTIGIMNSGPKKPPTLADYFETGTHMVFKKGETIVRSQDQPSGIFFIQHGYVKAQTLTKYGEENVLFIRKSGEVFPLIWAFTGLHRDVSYEAMEQTSLWRVPREEYLAYIESNPEVMRLVLGSAIEAYRLHSERVMTLCYRSVRERVVSFLLSSAERFGAKTTHGTLINAPLRQHDIASSINAARESTSRELSYLARKGWIILTEEHAIIIVDEAKLRSLL